MPIDWANVSWVYIAVLAVFVFLSSLIGSLLSFRHHVLGAVLSAVLFAAAFVFWTYYPHHLPLPTQLTEMAAPVPAKPAVPQKPANPVTTSPRPSLPNKPNQ